MKIKKLAIPHGSLIGRNLPADYADPFEAEVFNLQDISPDEIQIDLWTKVPAWVEFLMDPFHLFIAPAMLRHTLLNFA